MSERTIFLVALEKDSSAERDAYLNEACSGDASLRQRLDALLRSHDEAGAFLEKPAITPVSTVHTSADDSVRPLPEKVVHQVAARFENAWRPAEPPDLLSW